MILFGRPTDSFLIAKPILGNGPAFKCLTRGANKLSPFCNPDVLSKSNQYLILMQMFALNPTLDK